MTGDAVRSVRERGNRLLILLPVVLALVLSTAPLTLADVNTFEVQEYTRDFDVSHGVADENLAIQDRAVGIVGDLQHTLGERYAGVWFDNETGKFVVPTVSDTARGVVGEELAAARLAGDFRTRVVEHSWEELEAAQEQIDIKLREFFEADLVQTSIDPRTNAVVVYVASAANEKDRADLARTAKDAGVQVELRESDVDRFQGARDACGNITANCSRPLRGGVEIGVHNASSGVCTAAFRAIGDTNQQRYLISAGHCTAMKNPSDPIIHWDAWDEQELPFVGEAHYLGPVEQYAFPTHDWMKINVTGSWWETFPWPARVAYWGAYSIASPIEEEYPINGEAASYVGMGVCHSGASSGGSCGQVTAVNVTYNFGEGPVTNDLAKVKGACSNGGDSGGPWFATNIAYGIHIGSDSLFGGCGNSTYYSEITKATDALGVSIPAELPAPPTQQKPTVETKLVSSLSETEATLNGTVNPNGASTTYRFEYGKTTSYEHWIPVPDGNVGAGTSAVGAANTVSLLPRTRYHYRIAATNSAGTSYGSDQAFTTGLKWNVRNSNSAGNPDTSFWFGLPGERRVTGDWDGDGSQTIGVYNPTTGVWKLRNSNTSGAPNITFQFGGGVWTNPVTGDWDNNGTTTIGVYDPQAGNWNLRNSNSAGGANVSFQYGGGAWDTGVAGDWDNNGTTTIGVYDQEPGNWNLRNTNSAGPPNYAFQYGGGAWETGGAGDWDGNGTDTIGVYDQDAGNWNLRNTNSAGPPNYAFQYGGSQFKPVVGDWDNNGTVTAGQTDSNAPTAIEWQLRNFNASGEGDILYSYGTTSQTALVGDWNGDGIATPGTYEASTGTWRLRNSNEGGAPDITFQYGGGPWAWGVAGDWNGDGITTIGVYDPQAGNWNLRNSNSAGAPNYAFQYGGGVWTTPVTGDWDGNGTTTIGAYDPQAGNWNLRNTNSAGNPSYAFQYGGSQFKTVTGDWDNNGTTTIGIYEPKAGSWAIRNSNSGGSADLVLQYGDSQSKPLTGDWDGNGTETIGRVNPNNQSGRDWYLRNSNSSGQPDIRFEGGSPDEKSITGDWDGNGTVTAGRYVPATGVWKLSNTNAAGGTLIEFQYGGGAWETPVTGDWDGNGTTTIGVYDRSTGNWNLRNTNSAGEPNYAFQYGGGVWTAVTGDWDGNGTTTIGDYDPVAGNWNLRNTNSAGEPSLAFQYGGGVWTTPVTGDWDGNGTTTIGVYDPQAGNWNLRNSNDAGAPNYAFQYGGSQFRPLTGDWDGNGTTTIGLVTW